MAKNNNLTDFLTGVADAIRTKKGTTAKINPQNFETEISSITGSKPEQEKTTDLSMLSGNQIISPDSGKVLSKVTITKPTTLTSENIRKDTNIGGVVGTLEEAKPEQEKTVEATNGRQIISPDNGKTLSKVIVEAAPLPSVDNSIYKNVNKCLIDKKNKMLILGCEDSVIPTGNSITSIGDAAFYKCSGLTSVIIPDSVTSIGNWAFEYCSGLTNVTIGNSVTSIGVSAFEDCNSLTSVTIPDSVTSIDNFAFEYCSGLTNITIPDSVTSIGVGAFSYCSGLISATIGNGVTFISRDTFNGCSRIESLVVTTGNKKYHSANNCIIETATKKLIAGCKTSIIPSDGSVIFIGDYAFWGLDSLTNITIPDSVTSIGESAFSYCSGLTNITIPDSVTSIDFLAFGDCSGLTSVTIGNGVTSIGNRVFWNCIRLASVTMLPTTPPTLGSDAIPSKVTTITVPVGCGNTYKTAARWSAYADKIVEATA